MRMISKLGLAAVCAAALAGTAMAATRASHVMRMALPDGSVAEVHYAGDVAPKVTILPAAPLGFGIPAGMPMVGFDGMFAQMDREMAAAMRQMDEIARKAPAGGAPAANLAAFGSVPAGTSSYSVVTVSDNGHQCSRSTQVIGQGAGKPPKVISNVSGDCGPAKTGGAAAPIPDGPTHLS